MTPAPAPTLHARAPGAQELATALDTFARDGVARLPGLLAEDSAALLAERAQAIMAGELAPERWFYQHDSPSGAYEDLAYGDGFIGPSQAYRKVERLERDPWFAAWIEHAALAPLVRALIAGPVALCRAVLWNKAPHGGTELPWHQDGGPFWGLSQQPELQLWTALDDAPLQAGCVEAIPGSHLGGLASPEGGTIPRARSDEQAHRARAYPAQRGDVLLVHNLVWHRSGRNHSPAPRRALSVCYMSAATRCTRKRNPRQFTHLFGR